MRANQKDSKRSNQTRCPIGPICPIRPLFPIPFPRYPKISAKSAIQNPPIDFQQVWV